MKLIRALLVACVSHILLAVSSSGADLLQESFQPGGNQTPFIIDESSHNGTSNETNHSSHRLPLQQNETLNIDTFPSKIIINKQTNIDPQSNDHKIYKTPYNVEAPHTSNRQSKGYQENKHFKYNPGVRQPLNPFYSQNPFITSQSFKNSANSVQSFASTPFNTIVLSITPYTAQPHNNVPFNGLIINILPYNIPPSSFTPYNEPPFGDNPFNESPFGNGNSYNQPPFGHNPYNQPPFGHNPYNQPLFEHNSYDQAQLAQNPNNEQPIGQKSNNDSLFDEDTPYNESPFDDSPYQESPFDDKPYQESSFDDSPYQDPPNFNDSSVPLKKQNCSRQLRISELKCRLYSKCSRLDCDDPPRNVYYAASGVDAEKDEFPHAVALGWKLANRTDYSWACGGSLISEMFVLTAAHCAKTRDSNFEKDEPEIVRLGELDFADEDGDIQDIAIQEIIQHPDHKWPSKYHDIALLRLAKRAIFGDSVRPICLWSKETLPVDLRPTAIGWGALYHDGKMSEKLQKVYLDVVERGQCEESYGRGILRQGVIPEQLCAGDVKMDTCRGDSGGSLSVNTDSFGCLYDFHQVGVTSLGKTCGKGIPGVYTRVSAYLDWIEGHVWPVDR